MSAALAALAGVFGADAFERPLWLALLLALALAAGVRALRRRTPALAWPALPEAASAAGRTPDALRVLAPLLRTGALAALAVVLAGPVTLRPEHEQLLGLDVVLVLDASASMRAVDAEVDGEWRTRLDLARSVVARFARHRAEEGDRVGLVVFGETAFTQCPLTHDGALLEAAALRTRAGVAGQATALGDALALAVRRVSPQAEAPASAGPRAGRVVVLLTDGRSNTGSVPVDVATRLAHELGVRVHTVGIGSEGEVPMASPGTVAGRGLRFERHDLDTATLARIADATGGRSFTARRPSDLAAVYAEIDSLERVPRPAPPRQRRTPRPEPALAAALGLVLGEVVLVGIAARRIP